MLTVPPAFALECVAASFGFADPVPAKMSIAIAATARTPAAAPTKPRRPVRSDGIPSSCSGSRAGSRRERSGLCLGAQADREFNRPNLPRFSSS